MLGQDIVGGHVLHIIETSRVETAISELRQGLRHGIAVQIGHHHFAGHHGIDGKEDAAAFFHRVSGLGLLAVHHTSGQTADKDGIHHLHVHVRLSGQLPGLGHREIGEIRSGDGFSMPRNKIEANFGQNAQNHNESHAQQEILPNPAGAFCHILNFLFVCHTSTNEYPCEVTKNYS